MTLVSTLTREPFDTQIDRLFDEAIRSLGGWASVWAPACNVYEDEAGFCVQLALPVMESKDIEVQVENKVLTVKGERKGESPEVDRTYHIHEMGWGTFSRSFTLPSYVDASKASASFKEGMLTIAFPKYEEAKARRILIESK